MKQRFNVHALGSKLEWIVATYLFWMTWPYECQIADSLVGLAI